MSTDHQKPLKSIVIAPATCIAWFTLAVGGLLGVRVECIAPNPEGRCPALLHIVPGRQVNLYGTLVAEDVEGFLSCTIDGEPPTDEPTRIANTLPVRALNGAGDLCVDDDAFHPSPAAEPQTRPT